MALSAFDDKAEPPSPDDLAAVLGRSQAAWHSLIAHASEEHPPLDETWQFSDAKWGWSLRLKQKRRAVLYMTPCRKHFLVGLVLGERAVQAAHKAKLPAEALTLLDQATKYPEGRAIRVEIRKKADLEVVKRLASVKMAN